MAEVEIRLLGPFEVRVAGQPIVLTSAKQLSLLATLALSTGRSVPVGALADAVWGEELPARVRGSLQTQVMRLRQRLGDRVITTTRDGYRLDADAVCVDADRFLHLLANSRGIADEAQERRLLTEAVGLWRGEALDGLPAAILLEGQTAPLVERYLAALERRVDLDLAADDSGGLVGELRGLVGRYPLRESLWERLMRALAHIGRTAEALAAYADCRARLIDELGVEPGASLRQLHLELLSADDTADEPEHRSVTRNELPRDIGHFTGRTDELRRLLDAAHTDPGTTLAISAIDGMAGIGKTTLAVHAARRLAQHYPDGQLWLDLHAHTPGQQPLSPAAGLDRLLRGICVPGDQVPDGVEERAALWRGRMAGRRALVVLDNALHSEQVRPLLPGAPGCVVLVTSRQRLLDLDCAQVLSLDVLPEGDAIDLFARAVGDGRVAAEPQATAEVVNLCGLLPLAIRIAAARLRHRPNWTVEALADKLRDRQGRLAQLYAENRDLGAVFDLSYQHLTGELQRLFRLLGLHPGADIDSYAAGALAGLPPRVADERLQRLVDAHLLRERTPGRYQLHDLLRLFATRLAADADEDSGRAPLFEYYVRTAGAAMDVLLPAERQHRPTFEPLDLPAPELGDHDAAAAWLDAERANLLSVAARAAELGWHRHTVHLAIILYRYLYLGSHNDDALVLHTTALESARRLGDGPAEVWALYNLADVNLRCGHVQNARDHCDRALGIARAIGDRFGECRILRTLGRFQSGPSQNADCLQQAVAIARELGDRFNETRASLNLSIELWQLGRHAEALAYNQRTLVVAREICDSGAEQTALNNLGHMYGLQGDHRQAVDHLEQALSLARRIGYRKGLGHTLHSLADTYVRSGEAAQAARYLREALEIARDTENRELEVAILINMGKLASESGDPALAIDRHQRAVAIADALDGAHGRACAHHALGTTLHDLGELGGAAKEWCIALDLFEELGLPDADEVRAKLGSLPAR